MPEKLVRSLARNFPHGDSSDLDEYLIGRVTEYLGTHSLSLSLGSSGGERDNESSIEASGKLTSFASNLVANNGQFVIKIFRQCNVQSLASNPSA